MKKNIIICLICFSIIFLVGCTLPSQPGQTPNAGKYKVVFCDNYVGEKIEQYYDEKAMPLEREDLVGYVFEGWYEDSNFTAKYDFQSILTSDIMLFAKYTEPIYKSSYLKDISKFEKLTHLEVEVIASYVGEDYIICEEGLGLLIKTDKEICEKITPFTMISLKLAVENGEIIKVLDTETISRVITLSFPNLSKAYELEYMSYKNFKYQLVNYKGVVTSIDEENKIAILDEIFKVKFDCNMPKVLTDVECTLENLVVMDDVNYHFLYQSFSRIEQKVKAPTTTINDYETLDDILDDFEYPITKGLPSVGSPSVLVIPIEFTDYLAPSDMKENLELAFFDKTGKTGWESLSSYYYKSSYGALDIKGTVLEPFNTGKTSKYYENKYNQGNEDVDYEIIQAALKYYDSMINYSEYDYNQDGYIDSIYFVYTAPVSYGESYDECDLWWAYTYEYFTEDYEYYDNVEVDYYVFMGYDFLFEELCYGDNPLYVNINASTIIHETGHLLGLDDYYDYDASIGPDGGLGGADMMDSNVGDHNAYSKILLGWINPQVITGTGIIELSSFSITGEVLIIKKENDNNLFSEYLIIEFYDQSGLNKVFSDGYNLYSENGLKIYHVDADLKTNPDSITDITEMNNTDTRYKLISILEADGNNNITSGDGYFENGDLYQPGDKLIDYKWHDKSLLEYDIYVKYIEGYKIIIEIK